jgi:hypothetical protein
VLVPQTGKAVDGFCPGVVQVVCPCICMATINKRKKIFIRNIIVVVGGLYVYKATQISYLLHGSALN